MLSQTPLLLAIIPIAAAVLLPGECPTVPKTQPFKTIDTKMDMIFHTLLSVSFHDLEYSPLFHNINPNNSASFYTNIRLRDNLYRLTMSHLERDAFDKCEVTVDIRDNYSGESITTYGNVRTDPEIEQLCNIPKTDIITNVNMWIDGEFVIIYACKGRTDDQRDEAVLMMMTTDFNGYLEEQYKDTTLMRRLRDSAQKFLNESFLETMDWDSKISREAIPKREAQMIMGCICDAVKDIAMETEGFFQSAVVRGGFFLVIIVVGAFICFLVMRCSRDDD